MQILSHINHINRPTFFGVPFIRNLNIMSTLTLTQNVKGSVQTMASTESESKFVRPPMPVFDSLEEKQKHVKERLACALRLV